MVEESFEFRVKRRDDLWSVYLPRAGTETAEHWALPLIKQINQRIASGGQ